MDRPASAARKTVGAKLVAAREERKLTREEASRLASVPLRFTTMLEEGEYPLIADPAYLVPYLRRYATSLGLVAEALVLAFHAENEAADRVAAVQIVRSVQRDAPRRASGRFRGLIGVAAISSAAAAGITYAVASGVSFGGILDALPFRGGANAVAYSSADSEEPAAPSVDEGGAPLVAAPAPAKPAAVEEGEPAPAAEPEAVAPAAPSKPLAPERVVAPPPPPPPPAERERPPPAPPVVASRPAPPPVVAAARPAAKPAVEPARPAVVAAAKPPRVESPAARASKPLPGPDAVSRGHRLQLTATARQVWVWVAVDGGRRKAIELRKGKSVSVAAEKEILLSLDDAGGVDATLNGKRLPALGPLGQTRRNVRLP